jgi:hypothetical protein
MKLRSVLWILLVSASLTGVGHTAGGPMNEDLTSLSVTTQKAIEAGKRGDTEAFIKEAEEALAQAKEKPASASTQRIIGRLKAAVTAGKAGKLTEGTQAAEEALTDMKKGGAPRFGGGG